MFTKIGHLCFSLDWWEYSQDKIPGSQYNTYNKLWKVQVDATLCYLPAQMHNIRRHIYTTMDIAAHAAVHGNTTSHYLIDLVSV